VPPSASIRRLLAATAVALAVPALAAGPAVADDGADGPISDPAPAPVADPAPVGDPAPAPAPPAVTLLAPVARAVLGAGAPATLTAVASGDVRMVSFHLDGGPPICVFTHVHDSYECPFTPPVSLIGVHTLQARVQSSDGQVALAEQPVTVGRLLPDAVGARTIRRKLQGGAWRLTTTGSIRVPQGLTIAACSGRATVTVLSGSRTMVDRSVPIDGRCGFSSHVTLAVPRSARNLRIKVSYDGAQLLAPRSAPAQTLHLR